MYSKEFLESILYWEHKIIIPKRLNLKSEPRVYDLFIIHFASKFKKLEKIFFARETSKINNIWNHYPSLNAIKAYESLSQIGQPPTPMVYGPQKVE